MPGVVFEHSVWRVKAAPLVPATGSGVLDGLGVAVKDLYAVAGQAIGGGVPAFLAGQSPAQRHAPAVSALLNAGAQVIGIAQTDEFAYSMTGANSHYGTPPNPAAPDRVSGGSSSGPASAVALGEAEIGLGTDTAGSIRVPASYQNLYGLRTTHGAISMAGVLPMAATFDAVGWFARDLATVSRVASALLPAGSLPRRLLCVPAVEDLARPDIRGRFQSIVNDYEPVELSAAELERWAEAFRIWQAFQVWQAHGAWVTAHPGALGEAVAGRFAVAARITEAEAMAARDIVDAAGKTVRDWLADGVLVVPSAATPAPLRTASPAEIDQVRAATFRMNSLAGLAGAPALSIPALRSDDGLPVGLCLIGPPGSDRELCALAREFSAGGGPGS